MLQVGHEPKLYVDREPLLFSEINTLCEKQGRDQLELPEREGIIQPVQFADWAAHIIPMLKASLLIRGDSKLTVNKASKVDRYPKRLQNEQEERCRRHSNISHWMK